MSDDHESALRAVKASIARALLGGDHGIDPRLGALTLRPHQLVAVGRLLEIIASFRGALLADGVGLGKTYVALAVAREHRSAMVICPAALRGMWERAMKTAAHPLRIITLEALSRGEGPRLQSDLLIVDEAHHLRTPTTRRYEAVAHLCRQARVLLLSATPLHNSRRDLTSVLALFAGSAVNNWSDRALARLIVRRDDSAADQSLPLIAGPNSLSPGADEDCLDAILALPPAIPAAGEGVAHALTTISLVHLWTSSRAALVASVRKRLARTTALRDAVEAGHLPTAAELAAWAYSDGSLQLAFPLFTTRTEAIDQHSLNSQIARFVEAANALLERCQREPNPDCARATLLRGLRARHSGSRIVAFSQYAHTVTALGRMMRGDPGIAIVTASGARIASGNVTREEVLAQFSADAPPTNPVERIDLVLTTDLLSEGIDLRGASVIVHLDLPWNPARMEQRVGRARRMGSPFDVIHVYTFLPPTAAERLIELQRRLSEKVQTARAVVGGSFDPLGDAAAAESPVGSGEELRAKMRDWVIAGDPANDAVSIACGHAKRRGWVACVFVDGIARLIGDFGSGITDDVGELALALDEIDAAGPVCVSRRDVALQVIRGWIAARDASAGVDRQSLARRAVLDRLTQTVARAPRHKRAATIALAQRTRAALAGVAGVGTERVLATLARSTVDDDAWLQSIDAFGALHADDAPERQARDEIVAVILLEAPREDDATPERSAPS